MTQIIKFYIINGYVIGLSLNGKTNTSPVYLMNLVMRKLEPTDMKNLDRCRRVCWCSQHECDSNPILIRQKIPRFI